MAAFVFVMVSNLSAKEGQERIMQKYCIVPRRESGFWHLVQGMPVDENDKRILQSCVVRHVEISLKKNTWEILLQSREAISNELLAKAAALDLVRPDLDELFD